MTGQAAFAIRSEKAARLGDWLTPSGNPVKQRRRLVERERVPQVPFRVPSYAPNT